MKELGDGYESAAAAWLAKQGLQVLARNYRCRLGEIDIIALENDYLVFVEVRARSNPRYASAAASVDKRKQMRLNRTALHYLQCNPRASNMPCRFDVITFDPRQSPADSSIDWIRNAFQA